MVRGVLRGPVVGLVVTAVVGLAACSASESGTTAAPSPAPTTSSTAASPSPTPVPVRRDRLTLGVFGNRAEIAAYRRMATVYDEISTTGTVRVRAWPDRDAFVRYLRSAGTGAGTGDGAHPVPDVFLASRADLGLLRARDLNRPVDELLDERDVDFGDGYARDSIEGFSLDRRLQCMPYAVSPVVAYYNTDLIDFPAMAAAGLDVPSTSRTSWDADQFLAALTYATRPGTGAVGLGVEPTLTGLAPLLTAFGGQVYGDGTPPSSLATSSEATRDALARLLPVLRDPRLALTPAQVAQTDPVTRFERGRLAVVLGTRSLVPALRATRGLHFDVLPLPEGPTVGDVLGLCLSSRTRAVPAAADFLAWATGPDAVRIVTRTGYVVPTNQQVALTADFRQPLELPFHSSVFTSVVRSMVLPPFLDDAGALDRAVDPLVAKLLVGPTDVTADDPRIVRLTARIDRASQRVLAPDQPSDQPSDQPTGQASASAGG